MSSTQTSPVTRSAAAKLRVKRKSDGNGRDDGNESSIVSGTAENETPASKRQKLPVRSKDEKLVGEADEQVSEEDEEDSDDDAPEAISTSQAAAATRKTVQQATKAADKRAADQKRKRQERDTRLKAQAETRKAREEQEAVAVRELAEAEAKAKAQEEKQARKQKVATPEPVSKLLPLEFLESDSEDEEDEEETKRNAKARQSTKLAKKTKKTIQKQHPRDRQLGTTVYRVLTDAGHKTLAPKMRKYSRNVRQDLMARKRVGKPVGGGFLVRR